MGGTNWRWDLVELAAGQAAGVTEAMDAAFERLRAAGRDSEVEEALLQSYLFLGFPAAIEALRRWRAGGAPVPDPAEEGPDLWLDRGARVCRIVYGDHYEQLRENIARFHPDLDRWMILEGYGKTLGRPGLDLGTRELCIIAMLVVQGESGRRQLRSHLRGALNADVAPSDVEETIRRAARFAPPGNLSLALKLWSAIAQAA